VKVHVAISIHFRTIELSDYRHTTTDIWGACFVSGRSGRSLFSDDSDKCHCHVEALLEPPRRLTSTSVTGSVTSVASSSAAQGAVDRRTDNAAATAGSLIHGIASRLRARGTAKSVKYKDDHIDDDDEDTDVDGYDDDSVDLAAEADYDEFDDSGNAARRNSSAADKYSGTSSLGLLTDESAESLAPVNVDTVAALDDDTMDNDVDASSTNSGSDDAAWNPKKPFQRKRARHAKRSRFSTNVDFKLKTDPELDDELNAIQNDSVDFDTNKSPEFKSAAVNKVGHKTRLGPKSLSKKLKHVSRKKARLQTNVKNRVHSVRPKDSPKWEKKVCVFC